MGVQSLRVGVLIKIKSIKQGLLAVIRYHQYQHFGMHLESPQLWKTIMEN